ncbi:NAD-dependent protein deacylase [Paenibacillus agricola]|uniref:NAD-dependent protein deacetylase n=1 Tax=Paenibacillus agricola TaxID=2716264 RepID=A0ABX0J452_9BACL|nr:NAD-dependent protein deacylase [Paenibacillus agricola]NHN29608.1 NAD-dependent protein deacylase [Paenibacillus agricola]
MNFNEIKQIVNESRNIVFFGGAGTSTESGIPDFRSADGLYNEGTDESYTPEQMLSRDFFMERTEAFYSFYKSKMVYPDARPNPAHEALTKLEQRGQLQAIITQNIDGLHQLAGSANVLELHGSVHRNRCMGCQAAYPLASIIEAPGPVPLCERCGEIIKPDVVLYQESLDMDLLERAASYIQQAEVLIVAGTSLTVQPAAGLIRLYKGSQFILINKSATPMDGLANYIIPESIAKVLGALVTE